MKKAQVQTEVKVAEADVDDVVEIALQMMDEDEGQLSLEELREIGDDLDIPAEYIERAQTELQKTRAETKAETKAKTEQQAAVIRKALLGGGIVVLLVTGWAYFALSGLSTLHAAVEAQGAQVANVTARKTEVLKAYAGKPDSPDKTAEVIGAENRIRVENKRYSEFAADYNAAAGQFPAVIFHGVAGLPDSVPVTPK